MNEELFQKYIDKSLTAEEVVELKALLLTDRTARKAFARYIMEEGLFVESSGMLVVELAHAGESAKPVAASRGPVFMRRLVPLALAAGFAVAVAGWWLHQGATTVGPVGVAADATAVEMRVAEVAGKVSGFRFQVSGGSHPVAKEGNTQRPSGEQGQCELRVGDVLRPGDGVEVGADGFVKMAYADGSRVELERNTRLRVTLGAGENRDAKRLALDAGKLLCEAAKQRKAFEIRTPHATARVVGTRFTIETQGVQTEFNVQEGRVDLVEGAKTLTVTAGKAAVATATDMEFVRGVVYAWGKNEFGRLGVGTTNDAVVIPMRVLGLAGVRAVAAGGVQLLALKSDGSVWIWGYRLDAGGGTVVSFGPEPVSGLSEVTAVAAGMQQFLALTRDGTVRAWGGKWDESARQSVSFGPEVVPNLAEITAIAAGEANFLALKRDGTVWAWGWNGSGQLGDGTTNNRAIPVPVKLRDGTPLGGVVAIAAGRNHSAALRQDGSVVCWGANNVQQCGQRGIDGLLVAAQVPGIEQVTAISAGVFHTVALRKDGTVIGWGLGASGCLGDNVPGTPFHRPRMADGSLLSNVVAIATGSDHTVALQAGGSVWAWGLDGVGIRRDLIAVPKPVQIRLADGSPILAVQAVAAGNGYTVVVGEE